MNDRAPPMKPTPEMIAAAAHVIGNYEPLHSTNESIAEAALSAALSVPAEAVVGEPVGDIAYNAGLEIRYAIAASGVDAIQHIPEVDAIIERRLAEARKAAFIEAAEFIEAHMICHGANGLIFLPRGDTGNTVGLHFATAMRAKADEAGQ